VQHIELLLCAARWRRYNLQNIEYANADKFRFSHLTHKRQFRLPTRVKFGTKKQTTGSLEQVNFPPIGERVWRTDKNHDLGQDDAGLSINAKFGIHTIAAMRALCERTKLGSTITRFMFVLFLKPDERKVNSVALKRIAEDRKEWQKLKIAMEVIHLVVSRALKEEEETAITIYSGTFVNKWPK